MYASYFPKLRKEHVETWKIGNSAVAGVMAAATAGGAADGPADAANGVETRYVRGGEC